ncbi:Sas10 C-terminal domain-containing protein [Chaetomidium leptoderma]|uniref:Sas10 C-terminal domain-containing protein n=1 Tax=Chaetomidium leptoderma TaxID=669021 RepID=A0AAN6VQE3_9PEZI|nr:Sas10 C-terminal domain-containing protein [Chaetomidium leptoderma]
MAKKRKAPRKSEPSGAREVDSKDARLTIKTYKDVADSEDEYWANQDRIDFDDDEGPSSKRLKRQEKEDAFLEASDEEILGEEESDESEEEEEAQAPITKRKGSKKTGAKDEVVSDEGEGGAEEEEGDEGWWGSSRKEYYDADNIETEADALEEEAEARRLQAKKLAKMQEADFAFDESEWLAPKEQAGDEEEVVTEVLKEVEVTEDMGHEERYKLLQARYPEFDYLVDEFRELQPVLPTLQKEAEGKPAKSLEVVKSWLLGCYVAALASYFAILTSPSRDGDGPAAALNPSELRDHEVMETLMECRDAWLKASQFKSTKSAGPSTGMLSPPEEDDLEMLDAVSAPKRRTGKLSKAEIQANKKKAAEAARKAQAVEQSLADLSTMLKSTKKANKAATATTVPADAADDDNRSDFGEEDSLDARTAADKARRKKTLKFYTSQIVQKANKRAGAGRDAGGDMDIPYRERFRDRQARLNAEAERRGKKGSKFGADLGGDDSDGDDGSAGKTRGEDDEYYDLVAKGAQRKRDDKTARYEALAKARKGERVVESAELGPNGKRQITYQIQKNKGLTPHRKKEVRNPRVKKRMMYEEKQKKLRSVKAVYKGGEGPGGYQGELTGIKTGLVKSTKL